MIRKVCHMAYEQDLRKKLAVTFALPTLLRSLPTMAVRAHSVHILDSLCHILDTSSKLAVPNAQKEYQATLELLLDKIGLFGGELLDSEKQENRELFEQLVGQILQNLYSQKQSARTIAARLIEKVAARAKISVSELTTRVTYIAPPTSQSQPSSRQTWS